MKNLLFRGSLLFVKKNISGADAHAQIFHMPFLGTVFTYRFFTSDLGGDFLRKRKKIQKYGSNNPPQTFLKAVDSKVK